MPFVPISPAQHNGEALIRAEAVITIEDDPIYGGSAIGFDGGGTFYSRDKPDEVADVLEDADTWQHIPAEAQSEIDAALADAKIADERAEWYGREWAKAKKELDAALESVRTYVNATSTQAGTIRKLDDTIVGLKGQLSEARAEINRLRLGSAGGWIPCVGGTNSTSSIPRPD